MDDVHNFSLKKPDITADPTIEIILIIIVLVTCIILITKLFQRMKRKRNLVTESVIFFILFSTMAAIQQSLNLIIIPEVESLHQITENHTYIILVFAHYFLAIFLFEVFDKGACDDSVKRKWFFILIPFTIFLISDIIDILRLSTTANRDIPLDLIITSALLILTIGVMHLLIAINSIKTIKKIEDEKAKKGFVLIAIASLLFEAGFILVFLYTTQIISLENNILGTIMFTGGMISYYFGLILPMEKN